VAIVNKIMATHEASVPVADWKFSDILADPLIRERWQKVRKWFFLRESTYDMTNRCNIRCDGCYYYEGDKQFAPEKSDLEAWRRLMQAEKKRGITYVVLAGAEPALVPELCEVCYQDACCTPTTCQALGDVCGEQPDGCGGTILCGDTQSDPRHCGGCGLACASGETCSLGKCCCGDQCNSVVGGGSPCGTNQACCASTCSGITVCADDAGVSNINRRRCALLRITVSVDNTSQSKRGAGIGACLKVTVSVDTAYSYFTGSA